MSQANKTEKPTPKRLQDARKKGQTARSRELGQAVSLGAVVLALGWFGPSLIDGCRRVVAEGLSTFGHGPLHEISPGELSGLAITHGRSLMMLVGPVAVASIVAALGAQSVQGGWVFSGEALQFDLNRLNPATNLKRLAPSKGGLDTLKAAIVVSALGVIAWQVIAGVLEGSLAFAALAPAEASALGWSHARTLLKRTLIVLAAFGAADYALQKWRFLSGLKMTKQEVKDDAKLADGNPEIKARVRRIQREMARKRMLAAVPKATVVITNPTHYAVAIVYRRGMAAPTVLAKGRGLMAQRIKAIAREHGVPLMENVPLAQALYKGVEVGESIPGALFEAVAEVLAYLIRLNQLALA